MSAMSVADIRVFVDSNTFLYSIDQREQSKRKFTQEWLLALTARNCGVANLQVMNEVTNVLLRSGRCLRRAFLL